jgi:hypothetical protein
MFDIFFILVLFYELPHHRTQEVVQTFNDKPEEVLVDVLEALDKYHIVVLCPSD